MAEVSTLHQFYQDYFPDLLQRIDISPDLGHFNVFQRGMLCKQLAPFTRRDYFKISLIEGTARLHRMDKIYEIGKYGMVFYNPTVPYSWETVSEKQGGYFCLFNNSFITPMKSSPAFIDSALSDPGIEPVYKLTKEQFNELAFIFRKMQNEVGSDYEGRYDAIRHCLHLVLHEANKIKPVNTVGEKYINASTRISSMFIELLERQFPVDSTEQSLKLKSPHDFAERISVHVNHLNRAVKEVTGKSTTELIAARVAAEAKALLRHTDNSVAEIAYSLGFEHATNFNNFFKKQTGQTPKTLRSPR
jgi:AraC-like DNA-binding protein